MNLKKLLSKLKSFKLFHVTMLLLFIFGFQIITSAYVYKYDYNNHLVLSDLEYEKYVFSNYSSYNSFLVEPSIISVSDWNDRYSWLDDFGGQWLYFLALLVIFLDSPLAWRELWGKL